MCKNINSRFAFNIASLDLLEAILSAFFSKQLVALDLAATTFQEKLPLNWSRQNEVNIVALAI